MEPSGARRVLVVDDDLPILEAIGDLLRSEGFDVREEPQSGRAARSAQEFRPELVLLDLMMPGLDGEGVARVLRESPGTRDLPVVLMTAHPEGERYAVRIGARSWLRKPFTARALLRAVNGDPHPDRTNPELSVP